jgi:hypothetical protein
MIKEDIAREVLKIYRQIEELKKPLENYKDSLRDIANGETIDIIIEQLGKVSITKPRAPSEKTVLEINETKINANKELKKILLDKGIITEEIVKTQASKASVNIKPNV